MHGSSFFAWSLHDFPFTFAEWELLIGYGLFSECDDERALRTLACGLICLAILLLAGFSCHRSSGPRLIFSHLSIFSCVSLFLVYAWMSCCHLFF